MRNEDKIKPNDKLNVVPACAFRGCQTIGKCSCPTDYVIITSIGVIDNINTIREGNDLIEDYRRRTVPKEIDVIKAKLSDIEKNIEDVERKIEDATTELSDNGDQLDLLLENINKVIDNCNEKYEDLDAARDSISESRSAIEDTIESIRKCC